MKKSKRAQFSDTNSSREYLYDIAIRKSWWSLFFVEEYFTPRFLVTLTNEGQRIERGSISCEIAEHDEVSSFPNVTSFKDVQHFSVNDFGANESRTFKVNIESRFIKPTRYMMRVVVNVWEPSTLSPRDELIHELSSIITTPATKSRMPLFIFFRHLS